MFMTLLTYLQFGKNWWPSKGPVFTNKAAKYLFLHRTKTFVFAALKTIESGWLAMSLKDITSYSYEGFFPNNIFQEVFLKINFWLSIFQESQLPIWRHGRMLFGFLLDWSHSARYQCQDTTEEMSCATLLIYYSATSVVCCSLKRKMTLVWSLSLKREKETSLLKCCITHIKPRRVDCCWIKNRLVTVINCLLYNFHGSCVVTLDLHKGASRMECFN